MALPYSAVVVHKAQLPNGFPVSERNRPEKPNGRSVKPNARTVSERIPFGSEHFTERVSVDMLAMLPTPERSHVNADVDTSIYAHKNNIRKAWPAIFMGKTRTPSEVTLRRFR